jgi:hypothetical protein
MVDWYSLYITSLRHLMVAIWMAWAVSPPQFVSSGGNIRLQQCCPNGWDGDAASKVCGHGQGATMVKSASTYVPTTGDESGNGGAAPVCTCGQHRDRRGRLEVGGRVHAAWDLSHRSDVVVDLLCTGGHPRSPIWWLELGGDGAALPWWLGAGVRSCWFLGGAQLYDAEAEVLRSDMSQVQRFMQGGSLRGSDPFVCGSWSMNNGKCPLHLHQQVGLGRHACMPADVQRLQQVSVPHQFTHFSSNILAAWVMSPLVLLQVHPSVVMWSRTILLFVDLSLCSLMYSYYNSFSRK